MTNDSWMLQEFRRDRKRLYTGDCFLAAVKGFLSAETTLARGKAMLQQCVKPAAHDRSVSCDIGPPCAKGR